MQYTQERKQFGRVIGSFQALKHRMAEMYVRVETARSLSYSAAALVAKAQELGDDPEADAAAYAAEIEAAAAKVYCSRRCSGSPVSRSSSTAAWGSRGSTTPTCSSERTAPRSCSVSPTSSSRH